MIKPVRFPRGAVIHLGHPGDNVAICGQVSSAKPKHVLWNAGPARQTVTCEPCKHTVRMASL